MAGLLGPALRADWPFTARAGAAYGRALRAPIACWSLDPDVVFLNHGSFGACPRTVLAAQAKLRDAMEREPVRFLARDSTAAFDDARARLATLLGAGTRRASRS